MLVQGGGATQIGNQVPNEIYHSGLTSIARTNIKYQLTMRRGQKK